jgi:hypothetical protein
MMWHVCEEALAAGMDPRNRVDQWEPLSRYARELSRQYPTQQRDVEHWYQVCKATFPHYVNYWNKHQRKGRTSLLQEHPFDVPYRTKSGRMVRLRGKMDGVFLQSSQLPGCAGSLPATGCAGSLPATGCAGSLPATGCAGSLPATGVKEGQGRPDVKGEDGLWLFETKTKGLIDEEQLQRQLTFDNQTMLYLVALDWLNHHDEDGVGLPAPQYRWGAPLHGVCYNVVRRPLSGGKGTIVRRKQTKGRACSKCHGTGFGRSVMGTPAPRCVICSGSGRVGAQPEESKESFYGRVSQYIEDAPQAYFMRWDVLVSSEDLRRFRSEYLDPILEQLILWYETKVLGVKGRILPEWAHHWRCPYGVFNPLSEGGATEMDEYLDTRSELGLRRVDRIYPELEG